MALEDGGPWHSRLSRPKDKAACVYERLLVLWLTSAAYPSAHPSDRVGDVPETTNWHDNRRLKN
jgi:hypothetical protein